MRQIEYAVVDTNSEEWKARQSDWMAKPPDVTLHQQMAGVMPGPVQFRLFLESQLNWFGLNGWNLCGCIMPYIIFSRVIDEPAEVHGDRLQDVRPDEGTVSDSLQPPEDVPHQAG